MALGTSSTTSSRAKPLCQCESVFFFFWCHNLGITFTEYANCKDVVVWLPDERCGGRLPRPIGKKVHSKNAFASRAQC